MATRRPAPDAVTPAVAPAGALLEALALLALT